MSPQPLFPQRDSQMPSVRTTRRTFLQTSSAIGISGLLRADGFAQANDRPRIAAVGTGSRWDQRATGLQSSYGSAKKFPAFGDIVAVVDADSDRQQRATALVTEWQGHKPDAYLDYRAVIDRDDIDVVHISTPDHWHAKIAIEAMRSGKDVYCEKPMTLTIDEGRQMCQTCRETKQIVQVGTQQRSDKRFVTAVAMIHAGRIGRLKRVTCSVGGGPTSPALPATSAPNSLDWNLWLGPAPLTDYNYLAGPHGETKSWSRCFYEFRWWYEYSGGKLTDWGAHHVDIATWAMNKINTGPVSVNPISVKHPVPFKDGYPTVRDRYNTATEFLIEATYADGMVLAIRHDGDNGILFEGTDGNLFVNRGRLTGKAAEQLADDPLAEDALIKAYKGGPIVEHTQNFFESVRDRREPISDVFSHHRALTNCHLASIAGRLGRQLRWDPQQEKIVDDAQAQSFVAREPRRGFVIET